MKKLELIRDKFIKDVEITNSYVNYMQDNFYLRYNDVKSIGKLDELDKMIDKYKFEYVTEADYKKNMNLLKKIISKVETNFVYYQDFIENNELMILPRLSRKVKKLLLDRNLAIYLETPYMSDIDGTFLEYLKSQNAESIKDEIDMTPGSDEYYSEFDVGDYQKAIDYLIVKEYNDEFSLNMRCYNWLQDFRVHFKLYDVNNPINIYRQSFIVLLTAFDAVMFDIARELFQRDFFDCMYILSEKGKIEFSKLKDYGDFSTLKAQEVENCLKNRYIAELLGTIHSYKNSSFVINEQDRFDDILEIISRRNTHVHHNGIIDQKYFEKGNGKTKYGLSLGQYAKIDYGYYMYVSDTLSKFVNQITSIN